MRRSAGYADRRVIVMMLLATCYYGCQKETGPVAVEQSKLGWLGTMYGMYLGANKGVPPQSIDQFKQFVAKRTTPEELGRLESSSVDELFVSPRDGKQFRMVTYKKMPELAGGQPSPIVLYEEVGQNGERVLARLGGSTQVVSDGELQQMLSTAAGAK